MCDSSKSSNIPFIRGRTRHRMRLRNGSNNQKTDDGEIIGSLPNRLELPDIIPSNLKNAVPTYPLKTQDGIYYNEEPVWLQTCANGMVMLPDGLKPLPPLYVPSEFISPNSGIINNSILDTYSGVVINGSQKSTDKVLNDNKKNKSKNKLFAENVNTSFMGITNIDWTKNIIIVDLSYMTYKRFFATRIWYNNAFADRTITKDHDWCKDNEFMDKFKKLFLKHLIAQAKSRNVPDTNIIFAVDCRHVDNWRVLSSKNYKSTRKESHVKNNFHNFDIFPIVRNELIGNMQTKTGNLMLVHKHLEADDVVALLIKYIRRRRPTYQNSIFIVANDRDYIQICDDKTFLIDLDGKAISTLALSDTCNAKEYLLAKILYGDTSDNIPACYLSKEFLAMAGVNTTRKYLKATTSTVNAVMSNNVTKSRLIGMLDKCRLRIMDSGISFTNDEKNITKDNQFDYNARHMDFEHIPSKYATELNIVFSKCLGI